MLLFVKLVLERAVQSTKGLTAYECSGLCLWKMRHEADGRSYNMIHIRGGTTSTRHRANPRRFQTTWPGLQAFPPVNAFPKSKLGGSERDDILAPGRFSEPIFSRGWSGKPLRELAVDFLNLHPANPDQWSDSDALILLDTRCRLPLNWPSFSENDYYFATTHEHPAKFPTSTFQIP